MGDWLDGYAAALAERDGTAAAPTGHERNVLLELARLVAHGTERRNAPLATFVAGAYASAREAAGTQRGAALEEALDVARSLLSSSQE